MQARRGHAPPKIIVPGYPIDGQRSGSLPGSPQHTRHAQSRAVNQGPHIPTGARSSPPAQHHFSSVGHPRPNPPLTAGPGSFPGRHAQPQFAPASSSPLRTSFSSSAPQSAQGFVHAQVVSASGNQAAEVEEKETFPFTPPVSSIPDFHIKICLEKLRAENPRAYLSFLLDPLAEEYGIDGEADTREDDATSNDVDHTLKPWHISATNIQNEVCRNPRAHIPTAPPKTPRFVPNPPNKPQTPIPRSVHPMPALTCAPPPWLFNLARVPYVTPSGEESVWHVYWPFGQNGIPTSGYDPYTGALLINDQGYERIVANQAGEQPSAQQSNGSSRPQAVTPLVLPFSPPFR